MTEEGPNKTLYVGNLPWSTNEDKLRELFEKYGEIESIRIPMDREQRIKGFGFVEYKKPEDCQPAIDALNDTDLEGRKIRVNLSQPRSQDDRRGGGRYGGDRRGGDRYGGDRYNDRRRNDNYSGYRD